MENNKLDKGRITDVEEEEKREEQSERLVVETSKKKQVKTKKEFNTSRGCFCDKNAIELMTKVNSYRRAKSIPTVKFSISLCSLGKKKARELAKDRIRLKCGLKSWKNCCYTLDKNCMTEAPNRVVTFGALGEEIVFDEYDTLEETMSRCVLNDSTVLVLENRNWKSMGAGVEGRFVSIWFSKGGEPRSSPLCEAFFLQQQEKESGSKSVQKEIQTTKLSKMSGTSDLKEKTQTSSALTFVPLTFLLLRI